MQSTTVVLESARARLSSGDQAGAIYVLEEALRASPDDGRLMELLGVGQWDFGKVQESIHTLEEAMCLVPLGPDGLLALALGYEVIGKRDLARSLLSDMANRRNRVPARMLETLARALGRLGDAENALRVCQEAARAKPQSAGPLVGVAYYMSQLGRPPEEGLAPLAQAVRRSPEDFEIRLLLARRMHDCLLSEEAADLLREAPTQVSHCASCLTAMAEIFEAAGDDESAARFRAELSALDSSASPHRRTKKKKIARKKTRPKEDT